MPGSLVDLAARSAILPTRLIVDSSIVVDWLLTNSHRHMTPRPLTLENCGTIQFKGY